MSNVRKIKFDAEILPSADGYISLLHNGLIVNVPCRSVDQDWADDNVGTNVEIVVYVRVANAPTGSE